MRIYLKKAAGICVNQIHPAWCSETQLRCAGASNALRRAGNRLPLVRYGRLCQYVGGRGAVGGRGRNYKIPTYSGSTRRKWAQVPATPTHRPHFRQKFAPRAYGLRASKRALSPLKWDFRMCSFNGRVRRGWKHRPAIREFGS